MELEAPVEQNFDPAPETLGLWESRGVCAEMELGSLGDVSQFRWWGMKKGGDIE
jgi:hypothetical protein